MSGIDLAQTECTDRSRLFAVKYRMGVVAHAVHEAWDTT